MSFLKNATAAPVATGRASAMELVAEAAAEETLEELSFAATFSVTE
jgi:hypothetical protein